MDKSKGVLFVTHILRKSQLSDIKSKASTAVLCLENELGDIESGLEIIDANQYREEGSVLAYKKTKKKIEEISKKNKSWFRIDGVQYILPFAKEIYWSCFKNGYLLKGQDEFEGKILNPIDLFGNSSRIKNAVWILRYYFNNKRSKNRESFDWSSKICLLVNNELQLELWQNFILEFNPKHAAVLIPRYSKMTKKKVEEKIGTDFKIVKDKYNTNLSPKGVLSSAFSKHNHFFKLFLQHFDRLASFHDLKKYLLKKQCKTIVVNAFENDGASQVLMQNENGVGLNVVNTMNGIKAKTGNNFDSYFTKWIIWDEEMKELLINGCELPESQFDVMGHLIEDTISNHKDAGKFSAIKNELKGKKVVSIFSARDLRKDKVDGIKAIYEWANNREDIVLLYRPHPAEPKSCFLYPDENQKVKIYFIGEEVPMDKISLLDQLMLTDVSVVFASTVALESKWFGVPCITFEQAEKSLLYCIDSKQIMHSRTTDELSILIEKNLNAKRINLSKASRASDYAKAIANL